MFRLTRGRRLRKLGGHDIIAGRIGLHTSCVRKVQEKLFIRLSKKHTAFYSQDNAPSPRTYFRDGLLQALGDTNEPNDGSGMISSRAFHRHVARRIQYALPVIDKTGYSLSDIVSEGGVVPCGLPGMRHRVSNSHISEGF